jgi:hypothetical protein
MTGDRIRSLYGAQPFRPFIIHLADGRELAVQHREFLALSPTGGTAVVFQPDDSFNIVDMILVTDLEVKANGTPHQ